MADTFADAAPRRLRGREGGREGVKREEGGSEEGAREREAKWPGGVARQLGRTQEQGLAQFRV